MTKLWAWGRLAAVAGGYAAALALYVRAVPGGLASPRFAFVAMVCFLGLAFVARPVVPLRVPRALRRVRDWEAHGRFSRALGVRAFGTLLRRTPLRLLNARVYVDQGRSLEALALELEAAEASHLWDASFVLLYIVYAGSQGAWGTVFWFTVAQVWLNLYPIAHLRLARYRLALAARRSHRVPSLHPISPLGRRPRL